MRRIVIKNITIKKVTIEYDITAQETSIGPTSNSCLYYVTQGAIGTTVNVNSPSSGSKSLDIYSCYIPILAGDTIFIKVYGGNGARAWALTDSNFKILSHASASSDLREGITLTPISDGYLFVANVNRIFNNSNVVIRRTT